MFIINKIVYPQEHLIGLTDETYINMNLKVLLEPM